MNVVTYARVSTLRQDRQGQSLPNQERVFQSFLSEGGHVRVAAYEEAKSGKDIASRDEFSRMIAALATLNPDWVVVDTLDRFTRSLRDGLNLLEDLRGRDIRLFSIEAGRAFNPDSIDDWEFLVAEFQGAQRERMRNSARMNKSFNGRKARNATTHNRAPFGLVKRDDRLVPHPGFADVVREVDRRYVSGETLAQILAFVRQVSPDEGWKAENGIRLALQNSEYVRAGLRTPDMQGEIDARRASGQGRYRAGAISVHSLSGVFACGKCARVGAVSLLHGNSPSRDQRAYGRHGARLVCLGSRHKRHSDNFGVQESVLEMILLNMFDRMIADFGVLQAWHDRGEAMFLGSPEHLLRKRLEGIERQQSGLQHSRREIVSLTSQPSPGVREEVERLIQEVAKQERRLAEERIDVLRELSRHASRPKMCLDDIRQRVHRMAETWRDATPAEQGAIARSLVQAVGSHPIVLREGRCQKIGVEWDAVFPNELRVLRYGRNVNAAVEVFMVERREPPSEIAQGFCDLNMIVS
jgi:DNA invertase Pin-like site-specific DNA recombinase